MKTKHEPGPWHISKSGGLILASNDAAICDLIEYEVGVRKAKANARLIAKSPELLEMCEEFRQAFRAYELDNGDAPQSHIEMMRKADRIIAAAKGGSRE